MNVNEGGVYKIDKVELLGELNDVSPDALKFAVAGAERADVLAARWSRQRGTV